MSRRNIANYTTFNSILVNYLEIQNTGVGLKMYDDDITSPVFELNAETKEFNMNGTLNVTGDATFDTITVNEFEGGLQALASTNTGDTWDLGLYAGYNDGIEKYTGIIRDADDSLKRWTFFHEVTTIPNLTVGSITTNELAGVRALNTYVSDGTVSTPSISFDADIDTGLYRVANDEIGITAGGVKVMGIRELNLNSTEVELNTNTIFKVLKINTLNDIASNDSNITTGSIYIESNYDESSGTKGNDKWFKFYSAASDAVQPSYAGINLSSPSDNYFISNNEGTFNIKYNSDSLLADVSADYRSNTITDVITITDNTTFRSHMQLELPLGTSAIPSIKFTSSSMTGIFGSGDNSLSIIANNSIISTFRDSVVTFTQPLGLIDGTELNPSIYFTNDTNTGLYSSAADELAISTAGVHCAKFLGGSNPQIILPIGGTSSNPRYAFDDGDTGMYLPTDESSHDHLAFSLGGVETFRLRALSGVGIGNIEFFNSLVITPTGVSSTGQRFVVYNDKTVVTNELKGYTSSFRSYNLIDESVKTILNFENISSLGTDESGNGNNAVVVNDSIIAKSCEKDSNLIIKANVLDLTSNLTTDNYLNLTSNLSQYTTPDTLSFSFWFKIDGTTLTETNNIFNFYSPSGDIAIRILNINAPYYKLDVLITGDSTTLQYQTDGTSIFVGDNKWHHVVVKMGVQSIRMYYDNVGLTSPNTTLVYVQNGNGNGQTSTNKINELTGITQFTIGAKYSGNSVSNKYVGYLKDIYITEKSLTSTDISTLYSGTNLDVDAINTAVINVCDINSTNKIFYNDGSASSPSLTFTSDIDTGIYKSADNTIGFATTGVERFTISDTLFQFNNNAFEYNYTNRWLELNTGSDLLDAYGGFASNMMGPRIVFTHTASGTTHHSIRSVHKGDSFGDNCLSLLLDDGTTATDAQGLGAIEALRAGFRANNSPLITVFGELQTGDGSASLPSLSFTSDPDSGFYRIGSNNIGIATGGILKLDIDTVITVGNNATDATTRLYVPRGTLATPTYSFIDDVNTGIYSSAIGNVEIVANGVLVTNYSTSGQLNQEPLIIDKDDIEAFLVRKNGDPAGGDIFSVDTTNSRIGFGYTNLFLTRKDAYNSATNQILQLDSTIANTQINGLNIYNSVNSGTGLITSQIYLGKEESTRNFGTISFYYDGNGSTSNRLSLGMNGAGNNMLQLDGSGNVRINTNFEVSETAKFESQIIALVGAVGAPSYSFTGDLNTGIYHPALQQIGITTNGVIRKLFTDTYEESYNPIRLSDGTTSLPTLTFSTDTDLGFYRVSENNLGVTNGNQVTWNFNNRGTANHQCKNIIDFMPNGTNVRVQINNDKLRVSSNQTILEDTPFIHFKFLTDPQTDSTNQDSSIVGATLTLQQSAGYTYLDSSNIITLTDTNGVQPLDLTGIRLTGDDNTWLSATLPNDFLLIDTFTVFIRVKFDTTDTGTVYFIGHDTQDNFFRLSYIGSALRLNIEESNVQLVNAIGAATIVVDTWYEIAITLDGANYTVWVNGVSYLTGASTFSFSDFSTPGSIRLGHSETPNDMIVSEFYITPLTTTETVQKIIRTQAHEVYTNKLQIANKTGLVDEGYLLRSDEGNNAIWDNSLHIKSSNVELTGTKVFRVPNGTVANPSYSFTSDSDSGLFSIGADNIGIVTGGSTRIDINSTNIDYNIPIRITHQSDSPQLIIGRNSSINNGLIFAVKDLTAVTGLTGTIQDAEIFCDSSSAYMHLLHNGSAGGILIRNSDSTNQTRFSMFGSDGTNFNQSLEITTIDSGSVSDCRIHARSANDPINPTYSFFNNTNSGMYAVSSNNIGFSTNGVKRIDIADSVTQINNDLQFNSGFRRNLEVDATTSINLDSTHCVLEVSNIGNVTITLPDANASHRGREYHIIKTGSGGTITINTFDSNDHIDNNSTTSAVLSNQFDRVTLYCNGVNRWYTM